METLKGWCKYRNTVHRSV